MRRHLVILLALGALHRDTLSQSTHPCLSQNFDNVAAPDLPPMWNADGFAVTASVPRSAPNAAIATGNMHLSEMTSPICDFAGWQPTELVFYERRSSTAAGYRIEVSASTDAFKSLAVRVTFESAPVLSSYVRRSVDLSALGVAAGRVLQLRWRILPDSTNTTGVVRIDDIMVAVRSADDLAVAHLEILPRVVTTRDSIHFSVHLRNEGLVTIAECQVQFFLVPEGSHTVSSSDCFATSPGPMLAAGDSAVIHTVHPPMAAGLYEVLAVGAMANDGNPANDTTSTRLHVGAAQQSIVINEIMYAPQGDEPEWIELLNTSDDTVSLAGWSVSDHGLARKALANVGPWGLPPGGFGVVARDEVFLVTHPTVSCPIFMAEFSALNNAAPDGPLLYSDQGLTIDSVRYDPSWSGGLVGRTLERRDSHGPSNAAFTWAVCTDSSGSTPGRLNSTTRLEHDLAVSSLEARSTDNSDFRVEVTVANVGKLPVSEHDVLLFDDRDADRRCGEQELLAVLRGLDILGPGDTLRHEWVTPVLLPGEHTLVGEVRSAQDQRSSNDRAYVVVRARNSVGVLVINELMYEPFDGSCEWVELYNRSSEDVDLRGWELSDGPTPAGSVHRVLLSAQPCRVEPGDYVVIAGDSTIGSAPFHLAQVSDGVHLVVVGNSSGLGLANDGDAVLVKDLSGSTIDSLAYSPTMHHPGLIDVRGRSLERIRPAGATNDRSNWSTATGPLGGSPGRHNTIVASGAPKAAALSVRPNPFSPDEDGHEDFCIISVELPFRAGLIRARVFDTRGRMVRTLANAEAVGVRAEIIWNGLNDHRGRVPVGPYIILIEASDASTGAHVVHKAVAVVATRL